MNLTVNHFIIGGIIFTGIFQLINTINYSILKKMVLKKECELHRQYHDEKHIIMQKDINSIRNKEEG